MSRINRVSEKKWEYLLVGETQSYSLKNSGANIDEIANSAAISKGMVSGSLFE